MDTVTPLDGDGSNVVFPPPAGDAEDLTSAYDNVQREDYNMRGRTTVATPRGYAFVPSDTDVPVVTHEGVTVTAEQAEAIVAESDVLKGRAFIVNPNEED